MTLTAFVLIIPFDSELKCLSSETKMLLIFQRRHLQMMRWTEGDFFTQFYSWPVMIEMNHPTGYLITAQYWPSLIKQHGERPEFSLSEFVLHIHAYNVPSRDCRLY